MSKKIFYRSILAAAAIGILSLGSWAQGDWQDRIRVEPNQRVKINRILHRYGDTERSRHRILSVLRPDQREQWVDSGYDMQNDYPDRSQNYSNQNSRQNYSTQRYNQDSSNRYQNYSPGYDQPYRGPGYQDPNSNYPAPPYQQQQQQQRYNGGYDRGYDRGSNNQYPPQQNSGFNPLPLLGPLLQSGALNPLINAAGGLINR